MRRAGLTLILLLTVSGCARWVPAQLGTVPPGTDIRLRLSEDGAAQLEEMTGARAAELTGELLQWEPEVLVSTALAPTGARVDQGLRQRPGRGSGQRRRHRRTRGRRRTRTGFLVGGVVAVVAGSAIAWAVVNIIRGQRRRAPLRHRRTAPQEPFVRGALSPSFLLGKPGPAGTGHPRLVTFTDAGGPAVAEAL